MVVDIPAEAVAMPVVAAGINSQRTENPVNSDQAIDALKSAAQYYDRNALLSLFGPEFNEIITGDSVQDDNIVKHFVFQRFSHFKWG